MRKYIIAIIGLATELAIVLIVLGLLLIGAVGLVLPIIPGMVFIGLAIALYLFGLRQERSRIIPFFHQYVIKIKSLWERNQSIMRLLARFNIKQRQQVWHQTVGYSAGLFALNATLSGSLFLVFYTVGSEYNALSLSVSTVLLVLILAIFIYAMISALVWYRYGQALGHIFHYRRLARVSMVVVLAALPLGMIFIVACLGLQRMQSIDPIVSLSFMAMVVTTLLVSLLELFIVTFGAITKHIRL